MVVVLVAALDSKCVSSRPKKITTMLFQFSFVERRKKKLVNLIIISCANNFGEQSSERTVKKNPAWKCLSATVRHLRSTHTCKRATHSVFTFDEFLANTQSLAATLTLTPATIASHRDATCRTYCLCAHIKINQNNFWLVKSLRIVSVRIQARTQIDVCEWTNYYWAKVTLVSLSKRREEKRAKVEFTHSHTHATCHKVRHQYARTHCFPHFTSTRVCVPCMWSAIIFSRRHWGVSKKLFEIALSVFGRILCVQSEIHFIVWWNERRVKKKHSFFDQNRPKIQQYFCCRSDFYKVNVECKWIAELCEKTHQSVVASVVLCFCRCRKLKQKKIFHKRIGKNRISVFVSSIKKKQNCVFRAVRARENDRCIAVVVVVIVIAVGPFSCSVL